MINKKTAKAISCFLLFSSFSLIGNVEAKTSKEDVQKARQYYAQGIQSFGPNNMRDAAANFMEASRIDKDNPLYSLLAGDTLRYLKQYPSSMRYYNEALDNIKKAKKDMRNKIKLKAYIGLSIDYKETNEKAKAIEFANKAINDYPKDYRGYYILGNIYYDHDEDFDLAVKAYNDSLEKDKEQLDSYIKLIKLYNKKDNVEKVIDTYKMATNYRPLDESMKMALAQVYISHKKEKENYYKDAISILNSLVNVNPKNDFAHYYLSILYLLTGDNIKSDQELGITNSLNPNLGNRLAREIQAYNKKHANDPKTKDIATVSVDGASGHTTISIVDKDKKKIEGEVKDEITLKTITPEEKKEDEKKLINIQVTQMEKEKNKNFGKDKEI